MFSSLSAAKLTYLSAAYMVQSLKSKARLSFIKLMKCFSMTHTKPILLLWCFGTTSVFCTNKLSICFLVGLNSGKLSYTFQSVLVGSSGT